MNTPGTLFDDRYLLKELKGRGSFGEVWLATDQQAGIDFAIKIYVAMNPQGLEDFRKEYQLSCNLINSNLLHVNHMGVCHQDSCPYLVMPYCPRGSASMVGLMDEQMMWKFLHDVANGLAYLHNQTPPIVHQDIKPDNILQTQAGDFVITDFGISKQMRGTMHSTRNDTSGAVAYMGPERFGRQYQSIKASDIWSLGATLYELASGQLPFEGRGGAMMNAGAEIPDLPGRFSTELNDVVRSCMARDPWDRPSASQLVDMCVSRAVGSVSKAAPVAPPAASAVSSAPVSESGIPLAPSKSKSTHTPLLAVLMVVIVGLVGWIGYMMWDSAEQADHPNPPSAVPQPTVTQPAPPTSVNTTVPQAPAPEIQPATASKPDRKQEDRPATTKPQTTSSSPTSGTLKLDYAVWNGGIRNGKPQGKGTMTFTRDYDLQGHSIKAGDTVKGECVNGKLSGFCNWHSATGGDKTFMLGD